jgi:uncharacterized protein RhaS with RHS repeats
MHARYYNPNLGRFLSVDPIGGSVESSQSWNRYSYVENNPLRMVDPDGRSGIEAVLVAPKPIPIPAPPPALAVAAVGAGSYSLGRIIGRSAIVPGDTIDEYYTNLFDRLLNDDIPGFADGGLIEVKPLSMHTARDNTPDRLKAKDEAGRDRDRRKQQAQKEKEKRRFGPRESTPADRNPQTLPKDAVGPHTDIVHPETPDEQDILDIPAGG